MNGRFLSRVRAAWLQQEQALTLSSGRKQITEVRIAPDGSKLAIDVRAGTDLAQISAWTEASSVDVLLMRAGDAQPSILFSGSIGSLDELTDVFAKLRVLLSSNRTDVPAA